MSPNRRDGPRTLVTGGTGFIGSALVRRLLQDHHKVIVFDDYSRGGHQRLNDISHKFETIEGDVRDSAKLLTAAKGCENLFHLAFVNGTNSFYEEPKRVLDVAVKGALNSLETAILVNAKNYVIASSSEVYQQPSVIPTSEREVVKIPDVYNPRFSYAGGKLISELLTINYLRDTNIRHMIFRPHNVFGPNMGFGHVIPQIMRKIFVATNKLASSNCRIRIQGNGNETRAFCFLDDAVEQILVIYNNGYSSETYNIGVETERTIRNLIQDIGKILGIEIELESGERPFGGTTRRCPDISKIKSIGYGGNDNYWIGLEQTVAWYRRFLTNDMSDIIQ